MRPKKQGRHREFREFFEACAGRGELKSNTIRSYASRMAVLAERHDIIGRRIDIFTPSWLDDPDNIVDYLDAHHAFNSVRSTLSACITYLRLVATLTDKPGTRATAGVLEGIYCRKLRRLRTVSTRPGEMNWSES